MTAATALFVDLDICLPLAPITPAGNVSTNF